MTPYVVFDETTGEAKRWGRCPTDDVPRQAFYPGEVVRALEADVDPLNIPTLSDTDT